MVLYGWFNWTCHELGIFNTEDKIVRQVMENMFRNVILIFKFDYRRNKWQYAWYANLCILLDSPTSIKNLKITSDINLPRLISYNQSCIKYWNICILYFYIWTLRANTNLFILFDWLISSYNNNHMNIKQHV